jgi:hypothetical protein
LATGIVAVESEIADLRKRIRDTEQERDEWKRRALPTPLTPERDQDVRGWIARMWDQNAEGRGYARDLLGLVEYGAKQLADARTELYERLAAYARVTEERDRAVARAQILELALKSRRRRALEDAAALLDAAASAKRAVEHQNIADACEMQEQAAGLEEAADIVRKLSTSEVE